VDVVSRRLELLKPEGLGFSQAEIVKELSVKCACSKRTVYSDFEDRAGWQPILQSVLSHEGLLLKVVNRYEQIILVQQKLGHRSIENTQIYMQLIVFESDEYHSATATRTDEAEKLVQAGFEYVCTTTENIMLFRKRK